MTLALATRMAAALPQAVAGQWSARQIHDTVAAIARQRAYTTPLRQSILGRVLLTILRWIRDLLSAVRSWPDARYLVIAGVLVLIVIVAGRIVVEQRLAAHRRAVSGLRALGGERRDYWRIAAERDAAGDHAGACHAVYVAVLDALARTGAIKFHASKTAGDYARDLRRRGAPASREFAVFARAFERAVFGWTPPTHDDYTALVRAGEAAAQQRAAA